MPRSAILRNNLISEASTKKQGQHSHLVWQIRMQIVVHGCEKNAVSLQSQKHTSTQAARTHELVHRHQDQ